MSFGFGIGDFIAVISLAKELKDSFQDAPKQYQALAEDVAATVAVLDRIREALPDTTLTAAQSEVLGKATKPCDSVLKDIKTILNENLEKQDTTLRGHSKRVWARFRWDADKADSLRTRLSTCLTTLGVLLQDFSRNDVVKIIKRQDHEKILDWLAPAEYLSQHASHLKERLPGTGEWLFATEEWRKWERDGGMLVLHGIPGAGKTVLASGIIERTKAFYHYCDYTRDQDLDLILASLLRQVSTKEMDEEVVSIYERNFRERSILTNTLKKVLEARQITIVVDALDECSCSRELLDELVTWKTRIIITSRPLSDVMGLKCASLEIRASKEDVERYVDGQVSYLPRFVKGELIVTIKTAVTLAADGIFLLVKLHVDSLKGRRSVSTLRQQLKALNSDYSAAYVGTIARIHGQVEEQKGLAIDALTWAVHAYRPLKVGELLHALGTVQEFHEDAVPEIEDVLDSCCGLLIVEKNARFVRLVHKTALEFFKQDLQWLPHPHTKMSDVCTRYLAGIKRELGDMSLIKEKYEFYDYSAQFCKPHFNDSDKVVDILETVKFLDVTAEPSRALLVEYSPRFFELSHQYPDLRGLHLAAIGGLCDVIPLLAREYAIDSRDKNGRTPLMYAVTIDLVTADMLLELGADPNARDDNGMTPLMHYASLPEDRGSADTNSLPSIIQSLLNHGADLNLQEAHGLTAIMIATNVIGKLEGSPERSQAFFSIQYGRLNDYNSSKKQYTKTFPTLIKIYTITGLLLQAGAELLLEDNAGRTIIHHLLALTDTNERMPWVETAKVFKSWLELLWSWFESSLDIPELAEVISSFLPENLHVTDGIVVDSNYNWVGRLLFESIVQAGFRSLAKIFIEHNIDVKEPYKLDIPGELFRYTTSLHTAARFRRQSIIDLLLENGANMSYFETTSGNKRRTVLALAQDGNGTLHLDHDENFMYASDKDLDTRLDILKQLVAWDCFLTISELGLYQGDSTTFLNSLRSIKDNHLQYDFAFYAKWKDIYLKHSKLLFVLHPRGLNVCGEAIEMCATEELEFLLKIGMGQHGVDKYNQTPLEYAMSTLKMLPRWSVRYSEDQTWTRKVAWLKMILEDESCPIYRELHRHLIVPS